MAEEKKKKKGFLFVLFALAALLVVLVVFNVIKPFEKSGDEQQEEGAQRASDENVPIFAVSVTPAVLGPISNYFRVNGEVVAKSTVDIYADVQGILTNSHISLGDYVKKNTVIAEIDPSRPGGIYALSPVKTPVEGTVTSLYLKEGDSVGLQTPLATIGDLNRLQVRTKISERFISKITKGMEAEITTEAWPGYVVPLQVSQLNPVIDPANRTLEIILDLPRQEEKIKSGMYVRVKLTVADKMNVVKIPANCIIRRMGETFVYVQGEDFRAEKRLIVPGISLDDVVEIMEGLEAGEKVVYQGQTLLEDGVQVEVVREVDVL